MSKIQSMASIISEINYQIAVACLPAGFAMLPREEVFGNVLVINEFETKYFDNEGERPYLTLCNNWMTVELFHENYRVAEAYQLSAYVFTPVVKN